MLKLNSSVSYEELADEFWILYNSNISDISEVLEKAIDLKGWNDSFFTDDDNEPPASIDQYREILRNTRDDISKIITGAIAASIENASITQFSSDSVTIELESMPDFDIELIVRPKFTE